MLLEDMVPDPDPEIILHCVVSALEPSLTMIACVCTVYAAELPDTDLIECIISVAPLNSAASNVADDVVGTIIVLNVTCHVPGASIIVIPVATVNVADENPEIAVVLVTSL